MKTNNLHEVLHIGTELIEFHNNKQKQEGKKYLCFGVAESPDREEREPGVNWWKQEMPSDEEYAACEQNLEACG